MPEFVDDKKIFSLREVTVSIQKVLSARYRSSFWVKAEMNKLNFYPHSGHCYPDLVEKADGRVVAQVKSTLWKEDYDRLSRNFERITGSPLRDGMKILFCARIGFDSLHGLALRITDIDPVFSLGELEREKQECIALLKKEGLFGSNKSLPFPLVPQRIAVISVQTSKGYADFLKIIEGNPWGYRFFHVLFPSLLQGDHAVESIRHQLRRIRKVAAHFDVVAIIRGGGGDVGLSCFNDYQLARDIALFPLPVLSGIGHATNETVVEMVASRNAITPTELADYLLQQFHNFSIPVQKAQEVVVNHAARVLADHRRAFQHAVKYFRSLTGNILLRSRHEIARNAADLFKQSNLNLLRQKRDQTTLMYRLKTTAFSFCHSRKQEIRQSILILRKDTGSLIKNEKNRTANLTTAVTHLHPQNVLKRGYSITRVNGKAVTHVEEVGPSDKLETMVVNGTILSHVSTTKKSSL